MQESLLSFFRAFDSAMAALAVAFLTPAGFYLLFSGIDDLLLDLCWLLRALRPAPPPQPQPVRERSIAVFIPLWHEAGVIGRMLDHNLAAIDYSNYEVFAGVYQNDPETQQELESLASRHPRIHLAVVPHDGPTCKADCLNWVYQRLLEWEEASGNRMDLVVVHDAEDLIHPASFRAINRAAGAHDMIQVPVLALATPLRELTHGVYCDDFAESQGKDLATRVWLGGFLPGCGVGTAFRRDALDRLAESEANRLFQPDSLTEDYDNGLRMFSLGCAQTFLPLVLRHGTPIATREYFPRNAASAVGQRSRWLTGNVLQSWERHGWGAGLERRWLQAWFFWRDRKGLWGGPLSLLCNLFLLWGAASYFINSALGLAWPLPAALAPGSLIPVLALINTALLAERVAVRAWSSARIYGWLFAAGVPLRMIWGNWINARASLRAFHTWASARLGRRPLRWIKTEHAYPTREGLNLHKRRLGEILVANDWCSQEAIDSALRLKPKAALLGEYLVARGVIGEEDLYQALSLQHGLPQALFDAPQVSPRIARALPGDVALRWAVLPFRVQEGVLNLASPRLPDDAMQREIGQFTSLQLRFHLVSPSRFERFRRRLL